jgi:hypothetical protein
MMARVSSSLSTQNYLIPVDDLYLLGVLNSDAVTFAYASLSPEYRGGFLRFINQYMVQIPIPQLDLKDDAQKAQHEHIVGLVEEMLALQAKAKEQETNLDDKRHETLQMIARTDDAINKAVYALYGLTDDEIAVVEGEA